MTTLQSVQLPAAPITASPVPHLTSIHSSPVRGPYGDARYPGNCSGALIKDLCSCTSGPAASWTR